MSEHAANPHVGMPDVRDTVREVTGYWWVGLVAGVAWLVISLVILQFDSASVTTVGVLVGVMFLLAGVQNLALTTLPVEHRWVPALFSVLFLVSAVICFIEPVNTFAGLADTLGFLFLIVGAGFAGLFAVKALRGADVDVTVTTAQTITCSSRCCTSWPRASSPRATSRHPPGTSGAITTQQVFARHVGEVQAAAVDRGAAALRSPSRS